MKETGYSEKPRINRKSRVPSKRRVIGYAAGAILASLIFVGWLQLSFVQYATPTSFRFRLSFALFFWLTDGFALTLFLMIAPWSLAVSAYRKLRWFGGIYFPVLGAVIIFTFGCVTASISPKPFFVDDQTFLAGAVMAAERQGLCFLLAGIAFGASYWFFGERHIPSREK